MLTCMLHYFSLFLYFIYVTSMLACNNVCIYVMLLFFIIYIFIYITYMFSLFILCLHVCNVTFLFNLYFLYISSMLSWIDVGMYVMLFFFIIHFLLYISYCRRHEWLHAHVVYVNFFYIIYYMFLFLIYFVFSWVITDMLLIWYFYLSFLFFCLYNSYIAYLWWVSVYVGMNTAT